MIEEETCSICLNEFGEDEQCHCLDECNHKFHTKCIISWFRKASTCPNCRDNTVDEIKHIPAFTLRERGKELRKIARKKDAPEALKKQVAKLKKIDAEMKEKAKVLSEFRKEHKEVLNTYNKLRSSRWNLQTKKFKMERLIGLFQAPNYPLPSLIIQQGYY
jgi:hypothetical protein